jgi:hypothetical protein
MQQRLCFILILSLAVACAGFAQSAGGSSAGASGGAAGSTGTTTGTATTGTAPAQGGTAATTPLAPPAGAGVSNAPANGTAQQTPMAPPAGSGVDPAPAATGTNNANGTGNENNTGNNTTTNSNSNLTGGIVGSSTGATPTTPLVHLETVMPGPGASSNQPGAPAGASSMTNPVGSPSSPTTYTVPMQENTQQPQFNPNAASTGPMIQDMNGLVFANGAVSAEATDNRSLAEVAQQYKRNRATQNARVITNDDIARLNARNDVNVMGANQNAALPQGEGAAPAANAAPANRKRSPFTPKTNQQQQQTNEQPK